MKKNADAPLMSPLYLSWRRAPFSTLLATCGILLLLWHIRTASFGSSTTSKRIHPIYKRMLDANSTYQRLLNRQSKTLRQARREYAKRYHIYPPEGFDNWFAYAKEHDSLIIDDFDVINKKLEPFRAYFKSGCAMEQLDSQMLGAEMLLQICIQNGAVTYNSAEKAEWVRDAFTDMISPFLKDLPDVCFLMNLLDEPRIMLPTDRIPQKPEEIFCQVPTFISFEKQRWWSEAVLPCPPRSPARLRPGMIDKSDNGRFLDDFKSGSDLCRFSAPMQHGIFLSPSSLFVTHSLTPIASNAGLSTFSDIFFPSIWRFDLYDEYNRTEDIPWERKSNDGYWRGSTTGGESKPQRWEHFQRHRFVDYMNDEANGLANMTDVLFSNIVQCEEEACNEMKSHYTIDIKRPFGDIWKHKIVFDIDGNGLSGRFYSLLRSNSAVFRQSIFEEWHDDRMLAWLHYIPMSLDLTEASELLHFYLGDGEVLLREVAREGREMAESVLRKEDMRIYMYRLLIEMGRKY